MILFAGASPNRRPMPRRKQPWVAPKAPGCSPSFEIAPSKPPSSTPIPKANSSSSLGSLPGDHSPNPNAIRNVVISVNNLTPPGPTSSTIVAEIGFWVGVAFRLTIRDVDIYFSNPGPTDRVCTGKTFYATVCPGRFIFDPRRGAHDPAGMANICC